MSDQEKQTLDQTPAQEDHTPSPADSTQILSPRRRSALVTYLAILFAVAFLFVALTLALEAKKLKSINEALEDSSKKTSISLNNSINALQEENQKLEETIQTLQADNDAMTAKVEELEVSVGSLASENQNLEAKIAELTEENGTLAEDKAAMEILIQNLTQRAADAITVSELLYKAVELNEKGNTDGMKDVLNQIAPLKELLSATERDIYEGLVID